MLVLFTVFALAVLLFRPRHLHNGQLTTEELHKTDATHDVSGAAHGLFARAAQFNTSVMGVVVVSSVVTLMRNRPSAAISYC